MAVKQSMWQRLCSFSTSEQQWEKRQLSWVNNNDLIQYFSWNKKFVLYFVLLPTSYRTYMWCQNEMTCISKTPLLSFVSAPSPRLRSSWYVVILYLDQCGSHNTFSVFPGTEKGHCKLKFVNFEAHENHISHETQGLSKKHLVVRRGKPFKVTLLFGSHSWDHHTEILGLQVWLGIKDLLSAHM